MVCVLWSLVFSLITVISYDILYYGIVIVLYVGQLRHEDKEWSIVQIFDPKDMTSTAPSHSLKVEK